MAGFEGLAPGFSQQLMQFIQASGGRISISSGYRSPERQRQLWEQALRKYGNPEIADNWVARPGKSNHNRGIAADLKYADDAARKWAHANAGKFGLRFPMGHEPWHIEPVDADSAGHTKGGEGGEGIEDLQAQPEQFSLEQRLDAVLKIIGQSPVKAETMAVEGDVGAATKVAMMEKPKSSKVGKGSGVAGGIAAGGPVKEYARKVMKERFGWDDNQFAALDQLLIRESGWRPDADNPTSTAYGIFQFLDGTWKGTGHKKTSDPYKQIDAGLTYIKHRYGNPAAAWQFWQRRHWY